MNSSVYVNPLLLGRLQRFVELKDYAGLTAALSRLSHSQFRAAGHILGEQICDNLSPEAFWELFDVLQTYDSKAFLVTLLKAFAKGMLEHRLSLADDGFRLMADRLSASPTEVRKTLRTLLPVLASPDDVQLLFTSLGLMEMSAWIPFLLNAFHTATAFVLLRALHYVEADRALLLRVGAHLVSSSDALSFNVASIIKAVYGLDELRGTFSLRLQPFQLARIEASFEAFQQTVCF